MPTSRFIAAERGGRGRATNQLLLVGRSSIRLLGALDKRLVAADHDDVGGGARAPPPREELRRLVSRWALRDLATVTRSSALFHLRGIRRLREPLPFASTTEEAQPALRALDAFLRVLLQWQLMLLWLLMLLVLDEDRASVDRKPLCVPCLQVLIERRGRICWQLECLVPAICVLEHL